MYLEMYASGPAQSACKNHARDVLCNDISRMDTLVKHDGGKHGLYTNAVDANVRACRSPIRVANL